MKGFFELLYEEPTKLMILGASCSVVSQPVAETSKHWNLVQMSFSSASDVLSLRNRFPYFFRTNPAESGVNTPRIAIIKEFGWERVAIIHDNSEVFTSATNKFLEDLAKNNITLVAKESFTAGEKPTVQLQSMKDKDARIIIASAQEEGYQQIFCEAYHLGLYGKRYVWIINSYNSVDWWKNVTWLGCTEEEMHKVVDNYIGAVVLGSRTDSNKTVSGLTASGYEDAYIAYTQGVPYSGVEYGSFGYDAVWAVALALHRVVRQLEAENATFKIEDFDYSNANRLRDRFVKTLSELVFEGITGLVLFDLSGNRLSPYKIEQLIDGVEETVGFYLHDRPFGLQWMRESKFVFTGGIVPRDGPSREVVYLGIEPSTFSVFASLALIGMVMTVVFLIFNVSCRNRKVVKLSCPKVNNVIAIGCFMCYTDVILSGLDGNLVSKSAMNSLCLARVWILPISFTLAFGGLFAKTWRVHVIFGNRTAKRTRIFDYHLFMIIGMLVVVDIAIISVWTACDPIQLVQTTLPDLHDVDGDKIIVRILNKCDSPNSPSFLWSGIMFGWKGLLLVYGAFLAWESRKVTMVHLNDSKFIAIAIYNVAIPSIIIAPLVHLLDIDQPSITFTLSASCITFGTTITNCLIFLPKIIALWHVKDEQPEHRLFTTYSSQNQVAPLQTGMSRKPDLTLLREKETEIVELKQQLQQQLTENGDLLEKIRILQQGPQPRSSCT
ncbi:gamma-aminobutyric acid type B receptor subunit 2-like [Asterias amurensis]|uniref:gamma-aminobutyric acid type B receptor subunit 2-like n=1 Tax=Asterias amurensis TaxID=7602 RepID=UPI003AB28EE6